MSILNKPKKAKNESTQLRDHSFSLSAKFSKKLTFLIPDTRTYGKILGSKEY